MNEKLNPIKWDVSDCDPTTEFPKDCRRFNGGAIATKREQKIWNRKSPKVKQYDSPIFIDRLRE